MLGDNAYEDGTDLEYQPAVFDLYSTMLRKSVLWTTLGNHDGHTADSASQSGPFYDIFHLPRNGEAGGVASGTEAYYSFDYANVHLISLESYETDRSSSGAMMNWLREDLNATTQPWVIAFWHHPPYSKGSHDSDLDIELEEMRQNALPILEDHGVDLVFAGHSHSYERSFLLDRHFGPSTTFSSSMKLDGGSGRVDGTGAYLKPTSGAAPHQGVVYVVAGTSGSTRGGTLDHPAMFLSLNVLGSVVIDLNGLDLEVKFLDSGGFIRDYFTIRKGVGPPEAPGGLTATAVSSSAISLSWTDNSTVESSYLIERSPDGAAWGLLVQLPAGSSSHVDGGLSELTTYHYRVLARNSLGDSSYSDVASATTAANPQVITFAPAADARVKASKRTRNYGTETVLRVELNEHVCYLKFTVSGVSGPVTAATLSLFNSDGSNDGGDLYAVSNSWGESTITWSNAPAIQGTPLASVGAVSTGERVDLDLTPLITGNGTYSFALRNSSTNSATYSSREGTAPPYLELKVGSGPPPPTTDFSASPRTGEAPLPVAFTDLSTGSPTSWLWTFGDGGSSTLKNPTYTYQTAGTYGVTLAATNAGGTGTVTKADFITVNPAPEPGGGGPVEHHESVGGGSVSSAEVATEVAVVAHPDELYLVAVATKPFVDVVAVQGLGVAWKTVRMQCGGRAQSGVAVFVNEGQPNVSEPVRATLASAASAATIVVSKYTGANPLNHFGNVISGNTNGLNGACAGGVDTSAYSFNLPVTAPGAAAYGAVSIRQRTHTPGATFTERMEVHAGLSGSTAGVAVMDKVFGEPTTATLSGTLSSSTDWAFIALEIVP